MTDVLRKLGARRADKIPVICANSQDIKKHFLPLLAGRCLVLRWESDRISRLDVLGEWGTGAGGGFLPGEGRLRRRRPSSRQGSGQRRGRLELTLSSGCVKSGLGFFPDKNAKSLESFEERIFLSSSFPLGLKFHKKLLCDYCDRASRREWQLKIGGLAEIS